MKSRTIRSNAQAMEKNHDTRTGIRKARTLYRHDGNC